MSDLKHRIRSLLDEIKKGTRYPPEKQPFYWRWDELVSTELGFTRWYEMSRQERLKFLEDNRSRIGGCIANKIRYYRRKLGMPVQMNYKHRVRSDAEFEYLLSLRDRGMSWAEMARREGVTPTAIKEFLARRTRRRNQLLRGVVPLYPALVSILEHESPPAREVCRRNLNEQ